MPNWFKKRSGSPRTAPPPIRAASSEQPSADLDFAWRTHTAIQDWTRNVDQKASITLAIVTVMGGFAASQVFGRHGSLHDVTGDQVWGLRVMGVAFLLSGLSAVHAVFPSLKRRRARDLANTGLIYFGHLRHRDAAEIERALRRLDADEIRRQLAGQLAATSGIAWKKHARLQRSQVLLVVAVAALAVSELW